MNKNITKWINLGILSHRSLLWKRLLSKNLSKLISGPIYNRELQELKIHLLAAALLINYQLQVTSQLPHLRTRFIKKKLLHNRQEDKKGKKL